MKKIFQTAALLGCLANGLFAQTLVNNGATMVVNTGATLFVDGTFQNLAASALTNKGTINLTGNWDNSGNATQSAATATVVFSGTTNATVKTGAKPFQKWHMQKDGGATVSLLDAATINGELVFFPNLASNWLKLGNNHLTFGASAVVTDAGFGRFIVTDGTGQVKKATCATFTFPIGYNTATYNPVTIAEAGAQDTKSVRCLEHANAAGASGAALAQGVADASWQITEGTAGGSNATLTFQWASTDELPAFNRSLCSPFRYASGWQSQAAASSAIGFDPYSLNLLNASTFGYFMVGTAGAFLAQPNDRANDLREAELAVFPNPTGDFATVILRSGSASAACVLVDGQGRVLQKFDLENGQARLDLRGLPSGLFLVKTEAGEARRLVKI